jgi:hypothetical protein
MKVNVTYTNEMIKELIKKDIDSKLSYGIGKLEIDIKVRSKQNYREKDWETGELKVDLELDI